MPKKRSKSNRRSSYPKKKLVKRTKDAIDLISLEKMINYSLYGDTLEKIDVFSEQKFKNEFLDQSLTDNLPGQQQFPKILKIIKKKIKKIPSVIEYLKLKREMDPQERDKLIERLEELKERLERIEELVSHKQRTINELYNLNIKDKSLFNQIKDLEDSFIKEIEATRGGERGEIIRLPKSGERSPEEEYNKFLNIVEKTLGDIGDLMKVGLNVEERNFKPIEDHLQKITSDPPLPHFVDSINDILAQFKKIVIEEF